MPCAVDKYYWFILSWVVGIYVDSTIHVWKLNVGVGLNAHSLAGKYLDEDNHVVGVDMLERVLIYEIGVSNDNHSCLTDCNFKVLNCCRRRHNLIQQMDLLLIIHVQDDERTQTFDKHYFWMFSVSNYSKWCKIIYSESFKRRRSNWKLRLAGAVLSTLTESEGIYCLSLASNNV